MKRASFLVALTLVAAHAWGCAGDSRSPWDAVQEQVYKIVCTRDSHCGEREVCGPQKRCVPRARPEPASCGSDDDCRADNRFCLGGKCYHAPPCLNLAGTYDAYRADQASLPPVPVVFQQAQGQCAVSSRAADGGVAAVPVQGTLDARGAFTGTGGCTLRVAGDDTLSATNCPQAGGAIYHLYASATGADRFHPTRCGGDVAANPCDGHKCVTNDAGQCSLVACSLNSAQVPQCVETH